MHAGGCNAEYECLTISLLPGPQYGTMSYVFLTSGNCLESYYNCSQALPKSGHPAGCMAEAAMKSMNVMQFHCCRNARHPEVFPEAGQARKQL